MFTVDLYVADVRRFLAERGNSDLSELSPAEVSQAVLGQVGAWSPASVRRFGCALRSFLRYCFVIGLVDRDLSGAALPVSGRRRSLLPQGITPAQEKTLLGACDRRRSSGRRDYAVILLILRLGLRANEVATLRLDDLDRPTKPVPDGLKSNVCSRTMGVRPPVAWLSHCGGGEECVTWLSTTSESSPSWFSTSLSGWRTTRPEAL